MGDARRLLLALLAASVTVLAGCASEPTPGDESASTPATTTTTGAPSPSPSPATAATPSAAPASPSPSPPPAAPAEPEPLAFSGSGKRVTDEFTTTSKPLKLHMTHSGASNFAIWVMDATTGQRKELAVNEIGAYDGTRYFVTAPGKHVLDVTADGAWTVTITQPRPTTGKAAPADLAGTGDTAVEPLQLVKGLRRFAMTHEGSSNFAVWLLDASGNRVDLLANEIGAWNGEKAVGLTRDGIHYLDVSADGAWTIRVT